MKPFLKHLQRMLIALSLLVLVACSSVTIRPYGGEKDITPPSYQDSKDYYFWGLRGEHDINVTEICQQKRVMQLQSVNRLSDWALQIVTLGVYYPRTARVWCEGDEVPQGSRFNGGEG